MIAPAESPPSEAATRTILIVDDDRSVADTFATMLKLEGFGVMTALSADAGLAAAQASPPDAIILDLRMPLVDGLRFLRRLRADDEQRAVPAGVSVFHVEPLTVPGLDAARCLVWMRSAAS